MTKRLNHGSYEVLLSMLMFWLLAGLLCLLTVAALLMIKPPTAQLHSGRGEATLAIYKDQLNELDRDVAAGALGTEEADAQRTEISRRLLAASREIGTLSGVNSKFPKLLVLVVPLLAAALYSQVGRLGLNDLPREQRLAAAETSNDWEALIARVEDQLVKNPKDIQGWKLLIPNYLNLGRYGDAAHAMTQVIALEGPSADRLADLGEALVFENNGLVTSRSVAIIGEALKLNANNPKAQYYAALGMAQEGKTVEAKQLFQTVLAEAPVDAPYRSAVETQLAKLQPSASAPNISDQQVKAGQDMAPEDRMAMIRSMVDGLDEKLKSAPNDVEGWLRLIRARSVLGESDKALAALATARGVFASQPEPAKLLENLAQELKLK
jgi:cytochrome c-type biogenesis protein CcmH